MYFIFVFALSYLLGFCNDAFLLKVCIRNFPPHGTWFVVLADNTPSQSDKKAISSQ
jgi:hypothetical protein